jgi:hypothetical protein
LQWLSGEGPFPGPDDAGVVTPDDLLDRGATEILALYRRADQTFAEEAKAIAQVQDMERQLPQGTMTNGA